MNFVRRKVADTVVAVGRIACRGLVIVFNIFL